MVLAADTGVVLGIAGVVATVVFGLIAVYFWFRPRSRAPRLGIAASSRPLVEPDGHERISVLYDGVAVPRLTSTRLTLRNFGGSTISSRHVHQTLGIRFADGVAVLGEVTVSSSDDERIRPAVSAHGSTLSFAFDFLNAGDAIEVELLSTAAASEEPVRCGSVEGLRRGIEDVTTTSSWITRRLTESLDSEQRVATAGSVASMVAGVITAVLAALGSGLFR